MPRKISSSKSVEKTRALTAFTAEFVTDLAAYLSSPPAPPIKKITLSELLDAVREPVRALFAAGYSDEQIREFLAAKRVPVKNPEVSRFLRNLNPSARRRSTAKDEQ